MRSTNTAARASLNVLLAAIFLIASAEELWSRFIPDYLRALGAPVIGVAAYGTLKDFLDAIYQFPGGVLTAKMGYRASLVAFNAVAIGGYIAFAFATSWGIVVAALPLVMAWQSFSLPATFSLIGDTLPQGRRSMAFAYQSIVRRIPIVVAPIVGGSIIAVFGIIHGTRVAIFIGIVIALAALILQSWLYRIQTGSEQPLALRAVLGDAFKLNGTLKALLASDIIVRFGQGIAEVFVVLYAIRVVGVSAAVFGWLVGLAMATSIAVYLPVARIADARGRAPWVLLTYGFFALFPLLVAVSKSPWMLALAFIAMGLREIGEPPRKAMIVDLARSDRRSIDVGAYYLTRGLAVFPASLTFIAAAVVAATGAIVFASTVLRRA